MSNAQKDWERDLELETKEELIKTVKHFQNELFIVHDRIKYLDKKIKEVRNKPEPENLDSMHSIRLVDVDTVEEFIQNEDFPLKKWRAYRIEYGGHAEDCIAEGRIFLPEEADPNLLVQLLMGMQGYHQIWKEIK